MQECCFAIGCGLIFTLAVGLASIRDELRRIVEQLEELR